MGSAESESQELRGVHRAMFCSFVPPQMHWKDEDAIALGTEESASRTITARRRRLRL